MRTAVVGVSAAACLAAGCTIERPQPNLVGQDVRLTLIHTADIHSRLFPYNFVPNKFDQDFGLLPGNGPYGGIARIATVVKRIRHDSDRSLWLDSGDAWEGAPVFNLFKGEAEIRALSLAGMEGEVLGNHEFDLGSQQLYSQLDQWSQFPHFVANYAWDDPPDKTSKSLRDLIAPFQIYDVQGLKICAIGMGNQDTLLSSYEGGNSLGLRPLDNFVALNQWVSILRPICDSIVVVSHLGLDNDEGLSASQVDDPNSQLAIPGVDLILGGHLHIVTNPPKLLPNIDVITPPGQPADYCKANACEPIDYCKTHDCETLLVHSGAFAKYVGRLDLVIHVGTNNADPQNRSRIVSFAYVNTPIDEQIPDDPDLANLMWPYSVKLNQAINLNGVFAYVSPPKMAKITRNDSSGGDSQLGNLVARAMQVQEGAEAQFAFTNSLGIRADFERGPLTNEQMFNVFPFENTIVVMYLSGQEVQDTLDFVARKSASRGCITQVQASGISFDMVCRDNPAGPDPCTSIDPAAGDTACTYSSDDMMCAALSGSGAGSGSGVLNGCCPPGTGDRCDQTLHRCVAPQCAKNIYIGEHCRPVVGGILQPDAPVDPATTPCAPLNINGLYRVAVNNYIAAGGSGFVVLKRNTSQQDTGVSLRDSLTVYLSQQTVPQPDGSSLGVCDGQTTKQLLDATQTKACPGGGCIFDVWGNVSCLDDKLQSHDGRIRPVFQ